MAKGQTAGPGMNDESVSMSVRKIDNGFIVRKSCDNGNTYEISEMFSAKKPIISLDIAPSTPDAEAAGSRAMAVAKATLTK
jgi:hypothetical protein